MQHELRLPPLVDRIYSNVTYFTIKCLHNPNLSPHFCQIIQTSLDPAAPRPRLRPGGCSLVRTVTSTIRRLGIHITARNVLPAFPPWRTPVPSVTYTPTSRAAPPQLQRQSALHTIADLSARLRVPHHLYTDGSLQADGGAGCAVFSPSLEAPEGGWVGRRLPDSSSSTYCELRGLLDAVTLLLRAGTSGLVVCDCQPAIQALSSPGPVYQHVVHQILSRLAEADVRSQVIHFLWVPSHIGLRGNDVADRLARAACDLDLPGDEDTTASLPLYRRMVHRDACAATRVRRDAERDASVSIQHYEHFMDHPPGYRRTGLMVRRHNVVTARLRLGYRPVWQVGGTEDVPQFSSCRVCDAPNGNTLHHYCLECPAVAHLLPHRQSVLDVCKHLLTSDNLDILLLQQPRFGGCC